MDVIPTATPARSFFALSSQQGYSVFIRVTRMPSKNRRVALTVPDDLMALLKRLADLHGQPVSAFVVATLQEMQPELEGVARIMEAARSGKEGAQREAVRHMIGDALAGMLQEFEAKKSA